MKSAGITVLGVLAVAAITYKYFDYMFSGFSETPLFEVNSFDDVL